MIRSLVFRSEVETELVEAINWYEGRGKGIAAEFVRAFEGAVAAIKRNPYQYQTIEGEVRRAGLRRFPYSEMYAVSGDELVNLACFHGRRDPERWRERVR